MRGDGVTAMLSQPPSVPRMLLPQQQDRGQPQSREFDLFDRISQRLQEELKKGHPHPMLLGQQPALPMRWPHSSPGRTTQDTSQCSPGLGAASDV